MITIVLNGKEYKRDYKPNYCQLPGCGKRIQFRLSAKGVPESSDKYNARKGCCTEHSRAINRMGSQSREWSTGWIKGSIEWYLQEFKPNIKVMPDGSVRYE